jgi:hypothetical protein
MGGLFGGGGSKNKSSTPAPSPTPSPTPTPAASAPTPTATAAPVAMGPYDESRHPMMLSLYTPSTNPQLLGSSGSDGFG